MLLTIIESPYAGNIERNIDYARRAMSHCLKKGWAPIASHLLYTQPGILDDNDPAERALGITAGLEWARAADQVIFFTDLGWSRGMLEAREFYLDNGIAFEERLLNETKSPLISIN
jgi:hypothetical protein